MLFLSSNQHHSIRRSHLRNPSPRHSIRILHIQNPPANILSGHLASGNSPPPIFYPAYRIWNSLRRHSIRTSPRLEFFSVDVPPSPDISHPESHFVNSFKSRYSNSPNCLILHPQSFFRFQNRIFNKALLPLLFLASNFHTSSIFKMFWNKQEIKFRNSEQWSYRNWFKQDKMGFGRGPTYVNSQLFDWLIDLFVMCDWFATFHDMYIINLCLFTNPILW